MSYKLLVVPLLCCLFVLSMLATTVKPAKADYYWQTNVKNKLPRAAISAGSISDSPYPVYICRAKTNGNLHPGKLAYYNNRWSCFIGNGGVEERYETYDVLIAYGTTAFSGVRFPTPPIPYMSVM